MLISVIATLLFGRQQVHLGNDWHLVSESTGRLGCTVTRTQTCNAPPDRWTVYGAIPPDLPYQTKASASLKVGDSFSDDIITEPSYLKVRALRFNVEDNTLHSLTFAYTVKASLKTVRLVEGSPQHPPVPLTDTERTCFLAGTGSNGNTRFAIDYEKPAAQAWLDQNGLRRSKGESDLDFAYRMLGWLVAHYHYKYVPTQDRHFTALMSCDWGDCGAMVSRYQGILRANGIPTRGLCGLLVTADGKGDGMHCRMDFWTPKIGWVPVDVSAAMAKGTDWPYYFGYFPGDMIVTNVGLDTFYPGLSGNPNEGPYSDLQLPICLVSREASYPSLQPITTTLDIGPEK